MTRSEDFSSGADSVRQPVFKSVQQQHWENAQPKATPFQPLSVLDVPASLPNQNGMGAADRERRLMGVSDTVTGTAEGTFGQRLWLRRPESASLNTKDK